MLWKEIRNILLKKPKEAFYWQAHAFLILILYEFLFRISRELGASAYNGKKIWFVLADHLLPMGTLIISVMLLISFAIPLGRAWQGVKSSSEKKSDKKKLKAIVMRGEELVIKPKKAFRPDWWLFGRLILEGLVIASLIFIILRQLAFNGANYLLEGHVVISETIDSSIAMRHLHSNWVQDLALAFGSGFYEIWIFQFLIYGMLFKQAPRFVKAPKMLANFDKEAKIFASVPAALLCAILYTASHYLPVYGDPLNVYTILYHFLYCLILCWVYVKLRFATAAWTHVFHSLYFFIFI